MSPGLKGQILRTIVNERAKEFCKAVYEPGVRNYLVVAGKSCMTLTVRNDQYIWSHRWRNTQMLDVCESVDVIEKLRFVRSGQSFGAFGSWYIVGKRLVITIWS